MDVTIRPAISDDDEAIRAVLDEVDALHREAQPHLFRKPDGPVREREDILEQVAGGDNMVREGWRRRGQRGTSARGGR
jgi:hypothetical protein